MVEEETISRLNNSGQGEITLDMHANRMKDVDGGAQEEFCYEAVPPLGT